MFDFSKTWTDHEHTYTRTNNCKGVWPDDILPFEQYIDPPWLTVIDVGADITPQAVVRFAYGRWQVVLVQDKYRPVVAKSSNWIRVVWESEYVRWKLPNKAEDCLPEARAFAEQLAEILS